MKRCCHCHELKDESCFNKNRHFKDGLSHICRECAIDYYNGIDEAKKVIGGYKIFIPNHVKKNEKKYNILEMETSKIFATNDKNEFFEFLMGKV